MSLGPLGGIGPLGGVVGSVAGSPASQARGASAERTAATQELVDALDLRGERSEGVGEADGHSPSSDRDADGRRQWERTDPRRPPSEEEPAEEAPPAAHDPDDNEHRLDVLA